MLRTIHRDVFGGPGHRSAFIGIVGVLFLFAGAPAYGEGNNTIPIGTVITKKNWEQYTDFMPKGMQELFRGEHFWKMPDDVEIHVGETVSIPQPKRYREDTEKYSGQVTLKRVAPDKGFAPVGYIAGKPFPNPIEPDLGAKILYNLYYRYFPFVSTVDFRVRFIDRYYNISEISGVNVIFKLSHLSEIDSPVAFPLASNVHFTVSQTIDLPEQSKYTTQLLVYHDDPTVEEHSYAFVPSIRRSLRLSAASRCAPLLGTDWTPEDARHGFNGVPGHFAPEFIEEKKVLAMVHLDPENLDRKFENFYPPLHWPKPTVGKWELREVYVINIKRAPAYAPGYCYGSRIAYVDKETGAILWADVYDQQEKLWKMISISYAPVPIPGTDGDASLASQGDGYFTSWDIQNKHSSLGLETNSRYNTDVSSGYRDVQRWAMPSGLNEMMK